LVSALPNDRGGRFRSNADPAALVDKDAFGGNSPDDILCGQNGRHLSG
jgi:hypothetical protein